MLNIVVGMSSVVVWDAGDVTADDEDDVCVVIGAATTSDMKATQTKENLTLFSEKNNIKKNVNYYLFYIHCRHNKSKHVLDENKTILQKKIYFS